MKQKIGLHLLYWCTFWLVFAYTYSRYDGDLMKYALSEGLQMPARMLATYLSFWLLDQTRFTAQWAKLSSVALAAVAGGLTNRLIKLVYIVPVYFPDSSISFWGWRAMSDVFDVVIAMGIALTARLFFRQQESLRREETLKTEKIAAELRALRNQIQPHFLFNTINNIYALARIKSEKTAPLALKLAHLLRFVLYETPKNTIPLELEIKILQDYIEMEQLRFEEGRLQVTTLFDIETPQMPIAPALLLPLLENAFKHGASEQRDGAFVHIQLQQSGMELSCRIENSLPEQLKPKNPDGIGLQNVQRQLELLYPGKARLTLEKTATTFMVLLELRTNS
jgi:two-component system LytT family sensor kinase